MRQPTIDLNADLGETAGDLALMTVVTSANIACGGHAGDAASMAAAVEAALRHGVRIGAHPSYPDRPGFGRVELRMAAAEIGAHVAEQTAALGAEAARAGTTLSHLKLHGALYHRAGHDRACAEAILGRLEDEGLGPLCVLAQPGAELLGAARARGWGAVEEGFCDRRYRPDGSLADRSEPGAVLDTPAAAAQAVELARGGGVHTASGAWVAVPARSLCLHGDTPGAFAVALAVRRALEDAGVAVAAFAPP